MIFVQSNRWNKILFSWKLNNFCYHFSFKLHFCFFFCRIILIAFDFSAFFCFKFFSFQYKNIFKFIFFFSKTKRTNKTTKKIKNKIFSSFFLFEIETFYFVCVFTRLRPNHNWTTEWAAFGALASRWKCDENETKKSQKKRKKKSAGFSCAAHMCLA